jgi:hypothetical protein
MAFEPLFSAKGSPQDLQLMFVVVCENTTAFSLHFSHCKDKKLLRGFGIIMFSRFISYISYLQLADPQTFLHSLELTCFTSIA